MRNGIGIFLNWEIIMQNVLAFYWNRKIVMRNDIAGISVGAYCIRPIKTAQKETYDQKYRYMWGVFNTPLPWRQKGSIPKINFGVMRNGMTLFLIWKRVMRNGITFFLIRQRPMQNVLTFYLNRKMIVRNGRSPFLIWKMVMQNRLYLYLNRKMVMRNGRKGFLEHVFERCFWGTYFEGVFFFVTKRKHSGFVVKIRSAKQKESIWEGLFILAIMHGRA